MNPTIQLKQSVVYPKEHLTKRKILVFISIGVLFALMRLLFTGTNDGVPYFSAVWRAKAHNPSREVLGDDR